MGKRWQAEECEHRLRIVLFYFSDIVHLLVKIYAIWCISQAVKKKPKTGDMFCPTGWPQIAISREEEISNYINL